MQTGQHRAGRGLPGITEPPGGPMNQPHPTPTHCGYCAYRQAIGTLTIHGTHTSHTEPTCWTCAHEALSYYTHQPDRATFMIFPR